MSRHRGPSPKKEPPEPQVPRCETCGTTEVVRREPALCDEHDSDVRARKIELDTKAQRIAEKRVGVEMELEGYKGAHGMPEVVERLSRQKDRLSARLAGVKRDLEELQERCEHPQTRIWRSRYGPEEWEDYHDVDPDELPWVTVRVKCELCGYEEETQHQT